MDARVMAALGRALSDRDWVEDLGYGVLCYVRDCMVCGEVFAGGENRMTCKLCKRENRNMIVWSKELRRMYRVLGYYMREINEELGKVEDAREVRELQEKLSALALIREIIFQDSRHENRKFEWRHSN